MADPRFYDCGEAMTLGELAAKTGAERPAKEFDGRRICAVAPLEAAASTDVSYLVSTRHLSKLAASQAGACFISRKHAGAVPAHMVALVCGEPDRAYAAAANLFVAAFRAWKGISKSASIDPSARLGDGVSVGPGAIIGANVEIGDRTVIGANTVIGFGVAVGRDTRICDNASVSFSLIGNRVMIQCGARIGQDGFGFASNQDGHVRIPQMGRVIIQDGVEIGANSAVDRGAAGDTVIGEGTKIDNLVHIGHNCRVGRHCILLAQVGLAGSVTLGDFVVLAGQVGVLDHLAIGDGARVAARSGVTKNVPPEAVYAGFPAKPIADWRRQAVILGQLVDESRKRSRQFGKSE